MGERERQGWERDRETGVCERGYRKGRERERGGRETGVKEKERDRGGREKDKKRFREGEKDRTRDWGGREREKR